MEMADLHYRLANRKGTEGCLVSMSPSVNQCKEVQVHLKTEYLQKLCYSWHIGSKLLFQLPYEAS